MNYYEKARKHWYFLILFGVILIVLGMDSIIKGNASSHWPSTTGKVLESRISSYRGSWRPKVKFMYTVEGEQYISKEIMFGGTVVLFGLGNTYAENIVNEYPQDADIMVFYDPGNPKVAVLKPGINGSTFFGLILGVISLAVGWLAKE